MDCVYVIRHPASGMFYIGCTNNLQQRKYQHYSDLRKGIHANKWMQKNYGFDREFTWETIEAKNKEEAAALEKKMIHDNEDNVMMMNIQARPFDEAWCEALSTAQKGKVFSDTHREAISAAQVGVALSVDHREAIANSWTDERRKSPSMAVSINGIEYKSVRAAAKSVDVSRTTILERCRSTEAEWDNWKFTPSVLII